MKPAETKQIYEQACKTKRIKPQQEEGEVWHKVLRAYEARDVRAGLDAWWASTETDSKGELKSKWLPAPGELKPLVESAERKRRVEAAEPKDFVGWRCPACRHTCSGWTNSTATKVCSLCRNEMVETYRELASEQEAKSA